MSNFQFSFSATTIIDLIGKASNDAMNLIESRRKTEQNNNEILLQILDEHNLVRKQMPAVSLLKKLLLSSHHP